MLVARGNVRHTSVALHWVNRCVQPRGGRAVADMQHINQPVSADADKKCSMLILFSPMTANRMVLH